MSNYDQKKQKVNNQVNAENININVSPDVHSTDLACPLCMNNASTQKLSAVVKEGAQTSKLVEYLSLPPEPAMPSNSCSFVLLYLGILMGILVLYIPLLVGLSQLIYGISSSFFEDYEDYLSVLGVAVGFAIFLAAPIVSKKITDREIPEQKIQFELDHQNWQHAKNKWEKSYYCRRHDIVFIPENDDTVTPEKFKEFLYK